MTKNIIINFPTNFGDTIMGLPVLDRIRATYPRGKITVIASARTRDFLLTVNSIDEVVVFDKLWKPIQKIRFFLSLRGKYDIIVDLKNSFLPVVLGVKKRTPFCRCFLNDIHIKDAYLKIASRLIKTNQGIIRSDFSLINGRKKIWDGLNLFPSLFVACSSLSSLKRYPYKYLKKVVQGLLAKKFPLVILGEEQDRFFYKDILTLDGAVDLVGKTTISDAFYLLENYARLVLSVDTGILHLASYLNLPIVALFGPGDSKKSGPWTERGIVVKKNDVRCSVCERAQCPMDNDCMKIEPREVMKAIEELW